MTSPFDTIWTPHQAVAGWAMTPGSTARNPIRGWWAEFVAPPQGPPVMAAHGAMIAPTLAEAAITPTMAATGRIIAPAVGSGTLIAAPTLSAAAALIAPAVAELLTVPALSAGAVLRIPALANLLPAPALSAAAVMPAPTINTGTAISPPKLTAAAAMVAPTIGIGTAIIPPLLTAAAVIPAPALAELVVAPALSAAAAMPAPTVSLIAPSPAFDVVTAGVTNGGTTSAAQSITPTAGAVVLAFIVIGGSANTVTAMKFGSVTMPLVGSVPLNNVGINGALYVYKFVGAPTGATIAQANFSASSKIGMVLASYVNVTTVGTPTTAFGNAANPSQILTSAANQIIVQAFGDVSIMSATSGGAQHYRSAAQVGLAVQDGSGSITFAATAASNPYAAFGVVLS